MKKVISTLLAIGVTAFCFVSCGTTEEVSKLTTDWAVAELRDQENCGYFFTTPELGQFDMIESEFKKSAGYQKAAYGMIFGYSKPTSDGKLNNYIRFEINTDGEYACYKCMGGAYTDLVEENNSGTAYFYENGAIVKGYDQVNSIRVEKNSNGKWDVSCNGTKLITNIAPISKATNGAMAFFSVGKKNEEKLPDETVKVTYRITDSKFHVEEKK